MRINEILHEEGVIVPGVNTTVDVQPGETERQAAKFGNGKIKELMPSARKNSNPNTLFNMGLAEAKQRLDPSCWDGYKKQGTKMKGDKRVNNCVKESALIENLIGKTLKWAADKGYNVTKSMIQSWVKLAPPGYTPAQTAELITKGIATVGGGTTAASMASKKRKPQTKPQHATGNALGPYK